MEHTLLKEVSDFFDSGLEMVYHTNASAFESCSRSWWRTCLSALVVTGKKVD